MHRSQVIPSRVARLGRVPGAVGLVGTDESATSFSDLDRELLAATGHDRPRVALVRLDPAQLAGSGHGDGVLADDRWRRLGAEVETVVLDDPRSSNSGSARLDASRQAIGEADIVYVATGPRAALSRALVASPIGEAIVAAHRRGAIVVGCGAGAMLLGGSELRLRRRMLPSPIRWTDALGLLPGTFVLTSYDARPEAAMAALALVSARRALVLGIDSDTAAIGRDGSLRVYGRGRVTVWRGRHRERFRRGETIRL